MQEPKHEVWCVGDFMYVLASPVSSEVYLHRDSQTGNRGQLLLSVVTEENSVLPKAPNERV